MIIHTGASRRDPAPLDSYTVPDKGLEPNAAPTETGKQREVRTAVEDQSQRGELVGRNSCSRSGEMYVLREGC